ncbi:MAG TPA: Dyp-type peroxidase [Pseudonocardiaceae bacterium]|nr:Dyp-type peroxidase [Pseudonocardiaceae bacterium]
MTEPTAQEVLERIAAAEPALLTGVDVGNLGGEPAEPGGGQAEEPDGRIEPVYDEAARRDIQGNIVPGFNKDYQHFLFLRICDREQARRWVAGISSAITSMDEALGFVREYRARRLAEGVRAPTGLTATWVTIAFSHPGIRTLAGADEAKRFGEESFRQGLAARSTYLGDPTSAEHPGHRDNWVVGGPDNEADVLVVVAADAEHDLTARVEEIRDGLDGLDVVYEQCAAALPGALAGHEHFGFKDGVSQPGVRGRLSEAPDDFLTPRYPAAPTAGDADKRPQLYAKPGQQLVWPGQFLLGEPRQDTENLLDRAAQPEPPTYPEWARRGSYLVCRRLRQDVPGFWNFAATAATRTGTTPEHLASMMVGRWPSGAPLMRAATADDPALAGDEFANNNFLFDDDTRPLPLRPIPGYPGDNFPRAKGDMLGTVCPHYAHIRKTHPRDTATELGKPHDSMLRMIMRRGIAYGEPYLGAAHPDPDADRGLMFLCYGATIEDQFEFLTRRWSNLPNQPNDGGHDPVIGQRDRRGNRERHIDVPGADGATVRITIERDWVIPTGGGYFFAPPISALTTTLGEHPQPVPQQ